MVDKFDLNKALRIIRSAGVLLLLCVVLLPTVCVGVSADVFESNMPKAPSVSEVSAVYVYNLENDRVILEHNTESLIYPSSLTKVMSLSMLCVPRVMAIYLWVHILVR